MCNRVTMLYSRKQREDCKPAITKKNKKHYVYKKNLIFWLLIVTFQIILNEDLD